MSLIPLLKALIGTGIGPRRWLANAIKHGQVTINGTVVEDFRYPEDIEKAKVSIDGEPVDLKPERVLYLMLNKPRGILSTSHDERGHRTVVNLLPQQYRHLRLYPVGRLDKDSTGLLLLTNDGQITLQLTHPRFEQEKEYLVHIDATLKPGERHQLEHGLELEEGLTYPALIKPVASCPPFNYSLTIHEGRKRQIRRMFSHLGYRVLALRRIRIGSLNLGNLQEGQVRQLSAHEVSILSASHTNPILHKDHQ